MMEDYFDIQYIPLACTLIHKNLCVVFGLFAWSTVHGARAPMAYYGIHVSQSHVTIGTLNPPGPSRWPVELFLVVPAQLERLP